MESNRQYNLRSTKQDCVTIPGEIQTCTDKVSLNTLLDSKQSSDTADSESDVSIISELDCSAVINMSDILDLCGNKMSDEDKSIGIGSQQASSSGSDDCNIQMLVNQ